jgi:hypothetical protein
LSKTKGHSLISNLAFVWFILTGLLNSTPQLLACDRRAVSQGAQLGPGDLLMDPAA